MKRILIPVSKSKTQYFSNQSYVKYIGSVKGLEPVLVTPESNLDQAASECAGLLLTGGIDVDPIYYDMDNDGSFSTDLERFSSSNLDIGASMPLWSDFLGVINQNGCQQQVTKVSVKRNRQ